MELIEKVSKFIKRYCLEAKPLLLGLSGGPDSLALFYLLLTLQETHNISFHIAHIDHSWRIESATEAACLRKLAKEFNIPFHLKKLDPGQLTGNLEMACRQARYLFFKELTLLHDFQGIIVGHQQDDQVETVLKRIFEGSHWSNLGGLNYETSIDGMRILRPLLDVPKKDIYAFLEKIEKKPFEDQTNQDVRFMRARMRKTMIPWLNQTFDKNVQSALLNLSQEMKEMKCFFDKKFKDVFYRIERGPFGIFLDLKEMMPASIFEIKYLLRCFCEQNKISFSRIQYQLCAEALLRNAANFTQKELKIDRQKLYLLNTAFCFEKRWKLQLGQRQAEGFVNHASFIDVWRGELAIRLPKGEYRIAYWGDEEFSNKKNVDKWWTNHKVPSFLRPIFPLICQGSKIVYEFLTGKKQNPIEEQEDDLDFKVVRS